MTEDPRIEKIALALRAEAETFRDPVNFYVRWESNNRGTTSFDDDNQEAMEIESWKILARAALKAIDT